MKAAVTRDGLTCSWRSKTDKLEKAIACEMTFQILDCADRIVFMEEQLPKKSFKTSKNRKICKELAPCKRYLSVLYL